jgi:hypothetical protein
MTRIETICRILRDVGIFMLGIAAVAVTVHYVFVRTDPKTEMQNAVYKSMTQEFQKNLVQNRR